MDAKQHSRTITVPEDALRRELEALILERNGLKEQLEAARETLEYYAERRNHTTTHDGEPHLWTNDSYDGAGPGARARAVLTPASKPDPEDLAFSREYGMDTGGASLPASEPS